MRGTYDVGIIFCAAPISEVIADLLKLSCAELGMPRNIRVADDTAVTVGVGSDVAGCRVVRSVIFLRCIKQHLERSN